MVYENEYDEDEENLRHLFAAQKLVSFRIHQIQCSAGSKAGDNYMSLVKRVQISDGPITNTQNDFSVLSVIIKRQIPSLSRRQLFHCDEAFNNEISAYTHVVPLLNEYSAESPFPKCFYAGKDEKGDDIIMLEDLKHLGYHMQDRLTSLDVNSCELVMKELAKLHAASIIAQQLDNKRFHEESQHLIEIVYCKGAEEFYRNILEASIQESLSSLRTSNVDGCLTEPIKCIEKLQSKLFWNIKDYIVNSKENLSVMCHGDLWVNNIMFKNAMDSASSINSESSVPCAVKFIDLQAMRYTSPVFDLLHFFYTSTKRGLRDAHVESLLGTYSIALLSNLELLFTKSSATCTQHLDSLKNTFSLRNITAEYYEHMLYGLGVGMWILPAVTFDPHNIPNLDQTSEMIFNTKDMKCTQKLTQEYHNRMRELALEFYQNGFLKSDLIE